MRPKAADMLGTPSGDHFRENKHKTDHTGMNGPRFHHEAADQPADEFVLKFQKP
jgi:hypothetical protein